MRLGDFVEGLLILQPYYEGSDGYHIGAGSVEVYAYATDYPLTEEDVKKMRKLGWFQQGRSDKEYRPDEKWIAFIG